MIDLRCGAYCAIVAPNAGAALLALQFRGADILRPAKSEDCVLRDPRAAACFSCVPFFGRLYDGLKFAGRRWDVAPTLPACDAERAIHGYGWISPWRVAERTQTSIDCCFSYAPQPGGFPFRFDAGKSYALDDNGLTIRLSIANTGDEAAPAGLGLHPFFHRSEQTRVAFAAEGFWTPPSEAAAGCKRAIPQELDFSKGSALPRNATDHAFTGFRGGVSIKDAGAEIRLASDAPFLHLYAPADESFFCLEPVTHLPGRFGEDQLAPGAHMSLTMRVSAR